MQAASQQRYVLVVCRVCRTRMHPPAEWIGRTIHCPDCGTAAVVVAPELARPKQPLADPGEYALGTNWSSEPPAAVTESAAAETAAGTARPRTSPAEELVLVKCTRCGTRMHFRVSAVGRKARCPDCGTVNPILVPRPSGRPTGQVPAVPPTTPAEATDAAPHDYGVGAAPAPPPAPSSFVAPAAIVDRIEVPDPPRWTFFSGVFGFPWTARLWPRWAAISAGLSVAGVIAGVLLSTVGPDGLNRTTVLATGALGLLVFFSLFWSLSYASSIMLIVIRETAEGADTIDESPDIDWRDWTFQLVYMLEIVAQAIAAGWGARWLLDLAWPDSAAGEVGLTLVAFLLFPVLLLSALESGSALFPFSAPILRSTVRLAWAWGLFYLLAGALAAPIAGFAALTATPYYWLGCLLPGPLLGAYLIIYARLLGRLGWLITERLQPVAEDE
ncbi:MAG: hypothetical protein AB7U73_16530 [Pirellulales bacterium]